MQQLPHRSAFALLILRFAGIFALCYAGWISVEDMFNERARLTTKKIFSKPAAFTNDHFSATWILTGPNGERPFRWLVLLSSGLLAWRTTHRFGTDSPRTRMQSIAVCLLFSGLYLFSAVQHYHRLEYSPAVVWATLALVGFVYPCIMLLRDRNTWPPQPAVEKVNLGKPQKLGGIGWMIYGAVMLVVAINLLAQSITYSPKQQTWLIHRTMHLETKIETLQISLRESLEVSDQLHLTAGVALKPLLLTGVLGLILLFWGWQMVRGTVQNPRLRALGVIILTFALCIGHVALIPFAMPYFAAIPSVIFPWMALLLLPSFLLFTGKK
ncbi:MAG: hypothetical protein R3B84_02720 [Zavarzinella sp.]